MVSWPGTHLATYMWTTMSDLAAPNSDSALPNLTSPFPYALLNAYQATIPSHNGLPCTYESITTSIYAYIHALVSDSAPPNLNSALPNLTSSFTYAFPNAYQTIIPSHINLQCTAESCSASTHAYNHALVSDSAPPNLNSKFASAFSNAYQTTIPSQINLPCTTEGSRASTYAYNHALVSDSVLCSSLRFLLLCSHTRPHNLLIPISDTC